MKLILLRHGQTASNAKGLLLGRANPDLDDHGRAQADAVADALGQANIGRVISSPLQRTRATAETVAERCGVEVETDDRWIELDYGDYDRRPVADLPADVWQAWRSDVHFRPPGGETLAELGNRVRTACDELQRDADPNGSNVLVVSHVSPIKAGVAWALGQGDDIVWRLYLATASVSTVRIGSGPTALLGFNDVSHTQALGASAT
jgi:broad specificity phosphatase PhoE